MWSSAFFLGLSLFKVASACEGCSGHGDVEFVRNVRLMQPRQQPDAVSATTKPRGPLEWGQINFIHTSDTHGWLMGHVKEQNYGADWGDFVSFVRHMRYKAKSLGVDLLVVDSGDLHDGAGLSDATALLPGGVNGQISNPIFENLDYDLLTIGNHELYISDITYETFDEFAKFYRDRYLTSNVQIYNPKKNDWEYIGRQYKYFTTEHGVNIMSFGVLFDFTGNSNASRVIPAKTLVQEQWFKDAINLDKPIDMFVVLGHNPARLTGTTFPLILEAIRAVHPNTPVQFFGGHTRTRDFKVYDNASTAIEPGRYCETMGWVSMSGLKAGTGNCKPKGVPNPSRPAINGSTSDLLYSRRYLDWNRLTMNYHADNVKTYDTPRGSAVTKEITQDRQQLNLTKLYGCAPQSYCLSCAPQTSSNSLFPLVQKALAATAINPDRQNNSRIIYVNSGGFRFDLVEGPFTYDDSFIVAPFTNKFQYLPDVPYDAAAKVLGIMNKGPIQKRSSGPIPFSNFMPRDACPLDGDEFTRLVQGSSGLQKRREFTRRQQVVTPGYTTHDDFGTDGDDTPHSPIPYYSITNDIQANASFPTDGSIPEKVDVIFYDFIASNVVAALASLGLKYTTADVLQYMPSSFTSNNFLPAYAQMAWSKDC